jgi:hypothetical protein
MRLVHFSLTAVLLVVVSATAFGLDGVDGEYVPNVYTSSPNAIGDIKGEFTPNLRRNSWNAIGDIKGEHVPSLGGDRPNDYDSGFTPPWLDFFDCLFGF